jgi:glycosyltransferase involved in cell wall biosynthesis
MISGSGIQNKVLQAMAVGTPVVATSLACQALQVKNNEHILMSDDPQGFAQNVINLFQDKEQQRRISINARHYVEEFHNWEVIGRCLVENYQKII